MDADKLPPLPPFRYIQPLHVDVEDVEQYIPGGYHPVDIGDIICAGKTKYEVVHKLGHGGCSTVWLVFSDTRSSYFALKILCADVADYRDDELRILQHLKTAAFPGHPNVLDLYDSFKISGPNGEHQCLVLPALGPSLRKIIDSDALSSPMRHTVCLQVASAIEFLHKHRICHGDLTPSNIVFDLPYIPALSPKEFSNLVGPIKSERLRLPKGKGDHSPHAPKRVVQAADFPGLDFSLLYRVRLIDFGQAFFEDHPPKSLGVPISYYPPEVCFGYRPSAKSDIWQLACILYQAHTDHCLFFELFQIFENLIDNVTHHLGPMPQSWRGKFDFAEYGYVDRENPQDTTEPEYWFEDKKSQDTINGKLEEKAPHLSAEQRNEFAALLLDMVAYEPDKRLSAAVVVRRLKESSLIEQPAPVAGPLTSPPAPPLTAHLLN